MTQRDALDRTLLIARTLIGSSIADHAVLRQLTSVRIGLVGDEKNLSTEAGQTALVTLAQLALAQGASLALAVPEIGILDRQPPLRGRWLRASLTDLAGDSIPGVRVEIAESGFIADIVFVLGDTAFNSDSQVGWRLGGGEWWGSMAPLDAPTAAWSARVPIGAGIAAALASIEGFKLALRRAARSLGVPPPNPEVLQPTKAASVSLGDEDVETAGIDLGNIDFISGGAISNAVLHVLHRVPRLRLRGRIFEPKEIDPPDLNRYLLARARDIGSLKTEVIARHNTRDVELVGVPTDHISQPLADRVIVGADAVAARWAAQRQNPVWLGIGATADFLTMTSEHEPGRACAGCLHPADDSVNVTIPTLSTVSYWAGLALAARLLRWAGGRPYPPERQALNLWPLRLDLPTAVLWQPVGHHPACPVEHPAA